MLRLFIFLGLFFSGCKSYDKLQRNCNYHLSPKEVINSIDIYMSDILNAKSYLPMHVIDTIRLVGKKDMDSIFVASSGDVRLVNMSTGEYNKPKTVPDNIMKPSVLLKYDFENYLECSEWRQMIRNANLQSISISNADILVSLSPIYKQDNNIVLIAEIKTDINQLMFNDFLLIMEYEEQKNEQYSLLKIYDANQLFGELNFN